MPHELVEIEATIENAAWVRRLARSLAADEHDAEDLAQDAWVAALARGSAAPDSWKHWFVGVLRNLLRLRARTDARRTARELDAARPEPLESEPLERLEIHERLVAAVRGLDEPYRTVILLRYFDDLSPRAIAERTGAPVRTVHTRLHRGLEALRRRLHRDPDRGGAWLALLFPLVRRPSGLSIGGWLVSTKVKLAVAAVVVAAAFVGWKHWGVDRPVPGSMATPTEGLALSPDEPASPAEAALEAPRPSTRAEATPSAPRAPTDVAARAAARLHGNVIDVAGDPAPNASVVVRSYASGEIHDTVPTVADERGRFELDRPDGMGYLEVADPGLTTVLRPRFEPGEADVEHVIVVAQRWPQSGIVVDEQDGPLEGARVRIRVPPELRTSLGIVLDTSSERTWDARSDVRGAFELPDAPSLPRAELLAELEGYVPSSQPLPEEATRDLRIVLLRDTRASELRGTVVDANGSPVEGAFVALGDGKGVAAPTNARGEFRLGLDGVDDHARGLRAVRAGHLPAELECRGPSIRAPGAWPDPIVLVLGGEPSSIDGVVIDADGAPVSGATIRNRDPQPFGRVPLEHGGRTFHTRADVESLIDPGGGGLDARTGADGRFRIGGLQARSYRLRIADRRTMSWTLVGPIAAGTTGLEIRLPREDKLPRVAGRVVGRTGAPIAGADVWLLRALPDDAPTPSGVPDGILESEIATTDAEGRFEFRDVASGVDTIRVHQSGFGDWTKVSITPRMDLEDVRIVVAQACHLQVDITASGLEATGLEVLDENGERLLLTLRQGEVSTAGERHGIVGGRSEVLSVPETGATLVLYDGNDEVTRFPLRLDPRATTLVRP